MTATGQGNDDERFAREARRVLREGADGLDAATLSRLNRARQAALAEYEARRRRPAWLRGAWQPALGAAAVATLAVALWVGRDPGGPPASMVDAQRPEAALDLEVVLADESMEMLEDLEFYDWVGEEPALLGDAGPGLTG